MLHKEKIFFLVSIPVCPCHIFKVRVGSRVNKVANEAGIAKGTAFCAPRSIRREVARVARCFGRLICVRSSFTGTTLTGSSELGEFAELDSSSE